LASGTCMFAERVFKIHKGPGKAAHAGLLTHVRAGKRLYTYSCRRRHSAGAYCAPRCAAYRLGPRTCRDFRRYTARAGIELQSYRAKVCRPGGGDAMPLHYTCNSDALDEPRAAETLGGPPPLWLPLVTVAEAEGPSQRARTWKQARDMRAEAAAPPTMLAQVAERFLNRTEAIETAVRAVSRQAGAWRRTTGQWLRSPPPPLPP